MGFPKLKIKKLKQFFAKSPRALAESAFLTFLGLFLIVLAVSAVLFYKYNILIKKTDLKVTDQPIEFKKEIYDSVLQVWQDREKNLNEADSQNYSSPFK